MSYNWKTSSVDEEYILQFFKSEHYNSFVTDRKVTEAKGFERIDHFRTFLQQTGLKAVIDVNVVNDTPQQVRDLAIYCRNNNMPVIYWELGNEMSFLTANAGKIAPIFKNANDYITRAKVYSDIIKEEYPGAKTVIVLSNDTKHQAYDNDIFNYSDPYWDAISFHRYGGDGKDVPSAMKGINQYLDTWIGKLNTSYVSKLKDKSMPFFIGELGVELGGTLSETQYHGLFVAESILRLVDQPNIKYLGGYRFADGALETAASPEKMLIDAFKQNKTIDVTCFADM
jgi:hypothetical protein